MIHNARPKAKRSLDFNSQKISNGTNEKLSSEPELLQNNSITSLNECEEVSAGGTHSTSTVANNSQEPVNTENIMQALNEIPESNKRRVEDLFGDIDDIIFDDEPFAKKTKHDGLTEDERQLLTIETIIQERKRLQEEKILPRLTNANKRSFRSDKVILSRTVPRWNFMPLTDKKGERIYARLHSEEAFEKELSDMSNQNHKGGLLSVPFEQLQKLAHEQLQLKWDRIEKKEAEKRTTEVEIINDPEETLWVEKYKPKSYLELLSDESTNRALLQWLKLWDKVVFNIDRKVKVKPKEEPKAKGGRFQRNTGPVVNDELDEHGRPHHKIALLCGPPGLGKTTLAHLIAHQAGYNVVEVNASDDRSPETFRTQLEAATQMKAVMGTERRPNCLVLDEIDGAPAASIDVLLKFCLGKTTGRKKGPKVKKGAGGDEKSGILKRPIICICNDVYVPALRPLRQAAFVVHFPPTASASQGKVREFPRWSEKNIKSLYTNELTAAAPSPSLQTTRRMKQAAEAARLAHSLIAKNPGDCVEKNRALTSSDLREVVEEVSESESTDGLAQRLCEVARHQSMKTDLGVMMALSEKTNNDIRACLALLQCLKMQSASVVKLSQVHAASLGQKDMQKGLFTVWQEIFQIPRPKRKTFVDTVNRDSNQNPRVDLDSCEIKMNSSALTERANSVLRTVQGCGDYERLAQGVFENYLNMKIKDSSMISIANGLSWFCHFDLISSRIHVTQNYILYPYLAYPFVIWHLLFANLSWPKLTYPSSSYEMTTRLQRSIQLVDEVLKSMVPKVRAYTYREQLVLDTLPLLLEVIVPNLRPVSLTLYSSKEKEELQHVISVMIDYNLTYTQERTQDGNFVFNLDPNVEEVSRFDGGKGCRVLSYAGRQLVSREIELEKLRRAEVNLYKETESATPHPTACPTVNKPVKIATTPKGTGKKVLPNHLQKLTPRALKKPEDLVSTNLIIKFNYKRPTYVNTSVI
ncbi:Chromosome transmission fidelity protein 18 [Homalodisca vitripennis]|nr:Chromosome transmission fidelity protein 18 [Homalodisca vitripennis]